MTKYAIHIPRVLLGLLFVAAGLTGLYGLVSGVDPLKPPVSPAEAAFTDPLEAFRTFWLFVKAVETIGGAALLSNRYAPLGAVLLAPIVLTIVLINLLLVLTLPIVVIVGGFEAWLLFSYRRNYAGVFVPPVNA